MVGLRRWRLKVLGGDRRIGDPVALQVRVDHGLAETVLLATTPCRGGMEHAARTQAIARERTSHPEMTERGAVLGMPHQAWHPAPGRGLSPVQREPGICVPRCG